jgi:hypothetical protein
MQLRRSFALVLFVMSACTPSRTLPFTQLDGTTRIEVRSSRYAMAPRVLVAPDQIELAVATIRSLESGWEESMVTLPAGDVTAVFYRDTAIVGVFHFGRNFIVARGLIRSATPEELQHLAEAFEIPQKIITVPPRATGKTDR